MVMLAGANPAVSLPDLPRTRKILEHPEWFVVMQDASLTETARQADIVLPAALTILFANCGSFSCNFPRDFFTLASLYWIGRGDAPCSGLPQVPRAATTALFERIGLPGQQVSILTGLVLLSHAVWIHAY
jgi:Molybdopterin oxidoreductase